LPQAIAKLTRPSCGSALRRERLFTALDEPRRLTWIAASAGAGKTTLMSTWLDERGLRALWYAIDLRDTDPGIFFSHFSVAARGVLGLADLPEHAADERLGAFARRFFERVFAGLDAPFIVVLDNYQELAAESALHEVIDALASTAPPFVRMLIASRAAPPPRFARWLAGADFHAIRGPQLDLTREEISGVAAAHAVRSKRDVRQLEELACGWAAGTVLLARALADGIRLPARSDEPIRPVLDYFEVEVFKKASLAMRTFLLSTAWLPSMTAMTAAAVSGGGDAAKFLDELQRERLFVSCSQAADPVFEYHPLFRGFLQAYARKTLGAATLCALRRTTALLLATRGETNAAVALRAANRDWSALAAVVREHAHELAAHGQWVALGRWLDLIPELSTRVNPGLPFGAVAIAS
jgi:LuxR family maltose regulon positive regulatory protein